MFTRRAMLFTCLVGIVIGSQAALVVAQDRVLGRLTSVPPAAQVGGAIRVISTIKNASPELQRVMVSIWLVRPWGEQVKLGESVVELRSGAAQVVGVAGSIPHNVNPGPHSLGLVIGTQSGRAIVDTRVIRILPPRTE